jgi:Dolichyl-phosphate-mannose-protein mannosyltransferase
MLVLTVGLSKYRPILGYWFTGIDIFPTILSNRACSIGEVAAIFTKPMISFVDLVRPLAGLTYTLDYWIWGLNPFGYHLTDQLIHLVTSACVLLLARQLRLEQWRSTGLLAAFLFAIHPVHESALPLMTARFDLLLATPTLFYIIALLSYLDSERPGRLLLAMTFLAIAFGFKETAVLLVPLGALTALLWPASWPKKLQAMWRVSLPAILVLGAYIAYRLVILDRLGGYDTSRHSLRIALFGLPKAMMGLLLDPRLLSHVSNGLFVYGTALAFGVFLLAGSVHYALSGRSARLAFVERFFGDDLRPLFLAAVWLAGFFAMYMAAHYVTGVFKPNYLYSAAIFWCLLISDLLVRLFSHDDPKTRASGLLLLVLPLAWVASSFGPWISRFDRWALAGQATDHYLARIEAAVADVPARSKVLLINLPREIDCPQACVGPNYVLDDHSVDSWLKLTRPRIDMRFLAVSAVALDTYANRPASSLSYDPLGNTLTIENTGGTAHHPWRRPRDPRFQTEVEPVHQPRLITLRFRDAALLGTGTCLVNVLGSAACLTASDLRSATVSPAGQQLR